MAWQLAEAKNRFSEVVRLALSEGPQKVMRRGEAVVVVSEVEYQRLSGAKPSFAAYLTSGPSLEGIDLGRDASLMRDVSL